MFWTKTYTACSIILLGISLSLSGQDLQRYTFSYQQMGTTFKIILYGSNEGLAKATAHLAFRRIDTLNQIFSDYIPDSALRQLTDKAVVNQRIQPGAELWEVLLLAQQLSKKSKGAFDLTIGPLSKFWRKAFRQGEFPDREKIELARAKVGYKNLKLFKRKKEMALKLLGMRLDAGGIAKGYALDEAMKVLTVNGFKHVLIDGGGDILVSAPPPGQKGWKIQVEPHQPPLLLQHVSIATSGDQYRYLEWQGKRYSHIIDPRTGLGVSHGLKITVLAPNGVLADALASAVSVLGQVKGKKLIKKFKDCQLITL